jgi:hypothetical protein
MSLRDVRRRQRIPYVGRVRISWEGTDGEIRYADVKCFDISEGGLRIETPTSIPVRTRVSLRADNVDLAGSAVVKHVARNGSKFILGLQLNQTLQSRALAMLQPPWTLRKNAELGSLKPAPPDVHPTDVESDEQSSPACTITEA